MTLIRASSKPRALFYCLQPGSSVEIALRKCGVECEAVSDPVVFLKSLNQTPPVLSFIQATPDQFKIVRALVMSIRKILGDVIPLYLLLKDPAVEFVEQLSSLGASGRIEESIGLV